MLTYQQYRYALNDSPKVADKTKERIKKLAAEMNYVPKYDRARAQKRKISCGWPSVPSLKMPVLRGTCLKRRWDEIPSTKHQYAGHSLWNQENELNTGVGIVPHNYCTQGAIVKIGESGLRNNPFLFTGQKRHFQEFY